MTNSAGPAPDDPLVLERQVGFALVVATRTVLGVYRPLLEPLGLTYPQYLVMVSLWQHGPLSVKALGQLLHLDSATLSPLLKRLQVTGLLMRQRATDDERKVVVTLTDAGQELRGPAVKASEAVAGQLDLSDEDVHSLHDALRRVGNR